MSEKEDLQIVMKASDILKKGEFQSAVKQMIEMILQHQKQLKDGLMRLEELYRGIVEKIKDDNLSALDDLRTKTNQLFVGERLDDMDRKTRDSFDELKRSFNELTDGKLTEFNRRMNKIDEGDKISKKNLEGFTKIIDAQINQKMLELDGHKTDIKSVAEELKKEMAKIKEALSNIPRGRAMGRARVPVTRAINLTSQVDGATSAFTLDPDVVAVHGVFGTQFPINFNSGTDWTFAGRTLTLDTSQVGIPQSGQTLWALCDVLFYP